MASLFQELNLRTGDKVWLELAPGYLKASGAVVPVGWTPASAPASDPT